MALSLGSALATKVYLGATEVSLAYLGATQVYTSGPVVSYLLDDYSGSAVGYSLRNLSSSWTTSDVVEVRRSSDNATSGFTATEVSDGTMLAWVGTGGTDNGFVTKWYDQSGNTNDAVQATTTLQPKIVNAGALLVDAYGKPEIDFDASSSLVPTSAFLTDISNAAFFGVLTLDTKGGNFISPISFANNRYYVTDLIVQYGTDSKVVNHTSPTGTPYLFTSLSSSGTGTVYVNGVSQGSIAYLGTGANTPVTIGSNAFANGQFLNGKFQEYVLYDSDQSANLAGIESNIKEAYGFTYSAEAQNYFDRLSTAGDTTYTAYKQPLANYIDSLVALGGAYWDDMESAASFVGVGIQGVTVPLRDGMPTLTNNNFVAGDLDPLTGLLSDGSTKYLATGLTGTDLSQNDHSLSVYASSGATTGFLSGIYGTNFTRTISLALASTTTNFYSTAPLDSSSKITSTPSLVGLSRSASTEFTARTNQGDETFTRTSGIPNTGGLSLYAVGAGVAPTTARLATYHAGPALNLATLEGLQDTLISEIAAV